jgi:hypothetical protein
MAKKKRFPKSPKQSASLEVWQRHNAKIAEVKKFNNQIEADKRKKKTEIEKAKKAKTSK